MKYKCDKSQIPWALAIDLCKKYIKRPRKTDCLLEELVKSNNVEARRNSQFLFWGALRHWSLIHNVLEPLYSKQPNLGLKALLIIALFEIHERPEGAPKIIHFGVEFAKQNLSLGESRFVNAVLRKATLRLAEIKELAEKGSLNELALCYSHPEWLIKRWEQEFGIEVTKNYLKWNQLPPKIYARARNQVGLSEDLFAKTAWDDFYQYTGNDWSKIGPLLAQGSIYVQDLSTQVAPKLVLIKNDMHVLDLCAAPGGKSLLLADELAKSGGGILVSVDLPNDRLALLTENLLKAPKNITSKIIACDIFELTESVLKENNVPEQFDAVLLDVPCSNTGVIRRRPDIKERLKEDDFIQLPRLQQKMLQQTARFVCPGGQLVYSTCSIDKAENEEIVTAFLRDNPSFRLAETELVYPWNDNRDGASAFLLIRQE